MNLHETFTRAQYVEAADFIRSRTAHRPRLGLILGSGLNPLADEVVGADRIPYGDIPHFPRPGVEGHKGQLVVGQLAGQEVLIMQGRAHAYEGYTLQQVTLPVRVMNELGIGTLILTNAAGGLNPTFHAGDLMLINDHIGLMAIVGGNPLMGTQRSDSRPAFPGHEQSLRSRAARADPPGGCRVGDRVARGCLHRIGRSDVRDAGRGALRADDRRRRVPACPPCPR